MQRTILADLEGRVSDDQVFQCQHQGVVSPVSCISNDCRRDPSVKDRDPHDIFHRSDISAKFAALIRVSEESGEIIRSTPPLLGGWSLLKIGKCRTGLII